MISKHLEHDYRLAKGCFRVQGKPRVPQDHDAGSSGKVGARSRRETSRGTRPTHTCNRPLLAFIDNFALRPIRIPRTLPRCDSTASQNVPLVVVLP
ncbi:unnamed protein product [Lasius platythorax]|uniref:Uncharacterized protein n=1 Tax=Lasius platythorax TaxID=488582 RepID=A0AAV2NFZ9_9HYME